jgi:PKHD-type hydroxylase
MGMLQYSISQGFLEPQHLQRLAEFDRDLEQGQMLWGTDTSYRDCELGWISHTADTEWLYALIREEIGVVNNNYFRLRISGIEPLQYTEYPAGAGYYKPHYDWRESSQPLEQTRKLSFSIQLSDPADYDGGDLVFMGSQVRAGVEQQFRAQGNMIVFPSVFMHEVTPVTRGLRRSLVGWVIGPDWL